MSMDGLIKGKQIATGTISKLNLDFIPLEIINTGNILYVASTGSDTDLTRAGHIGNIAKPFLTLKAARNAAIAGDLIYVFNNTFTFTNTSANGYPYNANPNDVNLWKNNITWYFEPGCKIKFINETPSGSGLYLFRPNGGIFETCTVLGYLEYEQDGIGASSSNGYNHFFNGATIGTDVGYTFNAKVKSIYTHHCEAISIDRGATLSSTYKATVNISSEYEYYQNYTGGQLSRGSYIYIGLGNNTTEYNFHCTHRVYNIYYPLYIRNYGSGYDTTKINFTGDIIDSLGNNLFLIRNVGNATINMKVNTIYYNTGYTAFGYIGAVVVASESGGAIVNIDANLEDISNTTNTTGVFHVYTSNTTVNFRGNITLRNLSGVGRFVASIQNGSVLNITGNIIYSGTSVTTQGMLYAYTNAIINFNGKINGNFACPVAISSSGASIIISNSQIISTTDNAASTITYNTGSTLSTVKINSTYIELKNSTNAISNGTYLKLHINNSNVINSAAQPALSNTTNFGSLQLLNSVIISNGGIPINYTGTSQVVLSNVQTNVNNVITAPIGSVDIITELTY